MWYRLLRGKRDAPAGGRRGHLRGLPAARALTAPHRLRTPRPNPWDRISLQLGHLSRAAPAAPRSDRGGPGSRLVVSGSAQSHLRTAAVGKTAARCAGAGFASSSAAAAGAAVRRARAAVGSTRHAPPRSFPRSSPGPQHRLRRRAWLTRQAPSLQATHWVTAVVACSRRAATVAARGSVTRGDAAPLCVGQRRANARNSSLAAYGGGRAHCVRSDRRMRLILLRD